MGGILFAVCRGKLSEGIDFADNDARCVVVVGVPFADKSDPKIAIKEYFIDKNAP